MTYKPSEVSSSSASSSRMTFFGQPLGLANLFGVEMWERFSYYGMQAIVLYYMIRSTQEGGLAAPEAVATSIVGAYSGLVYLACLVASFVADRILGSERTLFYSAFLVMCGHVALALLSGFSGLGVGLILIAIGSGGIKTCAQVVLGDLYDRHDPRRDAGFSIFYMGVNIGALFGPLVTNWLWGWKGFHWGFGAAAVGMALGLIQYILMRRITIRDAGQEVPNPLAPQKAALMVGLILGVIALGALLIGVGIIPLTWLSRIVVIIALLAAVVLWVQLYTSHLTTSEEKSRLVGYIPLFISGVLFFGIFQQQFTVIALYADQRLNRVIFGYELSPALVQLINPIFIVIFSGVFAAMWTKLGNRQWSSGVKFGVANIIIGISLFFFLPFVGGGENSTSLFAIVWILFLFTMGELMLSPVGNSLATKVAPRAFPSRMMAIWMMAVSTGTALAGSLAGYYDPKDPQAEFLFFIILGAISIVLGVILILLRHWILEKFVDVR